MATPPSFPQAASRDGEQLYVPQQNRALPSYCVKCGLPSTSVLKKTFQWHPQWLFVFVMFALLIYIILAAIMTKRIALEVPLCDEHRDARQKKLWTAAALLIGFIPAGYAIGYNLPGDDSAAWGFAAAMIMFVAGLAFLGMSAVMRPTYIDAVYATFKGVSPEFLQQMPPRT